MMFKKAGVSTRTRITTIWGALTATTAIAPSCGLTGGVPIPPAIDL
jgi:hypothetical protein